MTEPITLPFGKVMVHLAFNCNPNARRGRPRLSQWDQTASTSKPGAVPKSFATREDLSRKSTVSRELVADYWMEGLFSPTINLEFRDIAAKGTFR